MTSSAEPKRPAAEAPQVSVVIPVYNSEGCLEELMKQLHATLGASGRSHEVILVNDGSRDGSWERIRELAGHYPALRALCFRRNFGQDNAIMAGLRESRGDVVVVMDDDLQHDPRDIERLVRAVEGGHDVCFARFPLKRQACWKNLGSWLNDKLADVVVGKPEGVYLSPYKAIRGEVAREITSYDGPFPYVDGLLFRVTTRVTQVDAEHRDRFAGASNYTLARCLGVWMRVATLFSVFPLRLATVLGFSFSAVGLLLALHFVIKKFLVPGMPLGWASTMVAILVLGGMQLACLGIVGEYLGRVFLHLNRRPQYSVKAAVGARGGAAESTRSPCGRDPFTGGSAAPRPPEDNIQPCLKP